MRPIAVLAAVLALALVAGCGGGPGSGSEKQLTVSAAASLKEPLEAYGAGFDGARVRLSFGGSDELAAQIRRGVRPDVYAAADLRLAEALHREGLVERPVAFAGNRLVIAVPAGASLDSVDDLARPGVYVAMGSESVPAGAYAQAEIARLDGPTARGIRANVRSREPDVKGVVGKVARGAVDAGFVYVTDVAATDGALRAVPLPARLQPSVAYGAAVVRGGRNPQEARRFVAGLTRGEGARLLGEAGFEKPR